MVQRLMAQLRFAPKLMGLMGVVYLFPLVMLLPYAQEARYAWAFVLTAGCAVGIGGLLQLYSVLQKKPRVGDRQGAVFMVMTLWLLVMMLGGLPFVLGRQLRPMQALFESVSGWTTIGFSAYKNLEVVPHIFLFYRSWMQLCGGLGLVLLLLLFSKGREAMSYYSAEGHGDLLAANLLSTARQMTLLYLSMVLGGVVLYVLCGMPCFDAINHAMAALATGGFSPKNNNIAYYRSLPIEVVTMVLMLLGATNFAALALLVKRKWRVFLRLGELRFFAGLMLCVVVALTVMGMQGVYAHVGTSLHHALFNAISTVTTTGYSIDDWSRFSPGMLYILLLLMLIGGASGSTAGGLKYSRLHLLCLSFWRHLRAKLRPEKSVQVITVHGVNGKMTLSETEQSQHARVALLFLGTFLVFGLLQALGGVPLEDALFEVASVSTGVSLGQPCYAQGNYLLGVKIVGMIMARMEVYVVYVFAATVLQKALRHGHVLRRRMTPKQANKR